MKLTQYQELRGDYFRHGRMVKGYQSQDLFIVTSGKHEGRYVRVTSAYSPKLTMYFEGGDPGETFDLHYTLIECTTPDGKPDIRPVQDMTGRDIEVGKWIVYSVTAGRNSHALEVGCVADITKTGAVKVARTLKNGERVGQGSVGWRNSQTHKTVNDPDRSLLLPVETNTLMLWVMTEFENLKESE